MFEFFHEIHAILRSALVFCGTACTSHDGVLVVSALLVPLVPVFTVKALEPSLLDAPFARFTFIGDDLFTVVGPVFR